MAAAANVAVRPSGNSLNSERSLQGYDGFDKDASVWDIVGEEPSSYFLRFGEDVDFMMFKVLRIIASIDAVWIPFLVSFGKLSWLQPIVLNPFVVLVDLAMSLVYTAGVLIRLRTGVVRLAMAQEFVDPLKVARLRLAEPGFWCDALSLLGAFWWHPAVPWWSSSLRIFRLWRIQPQADDMYELHFAELTSDNWVKNFGRMITELFLVIHLFACAWFYAATVSTDDWQLKLTKDIRFPEFTLHSLYVAFFADGARMLAGWGLPRQMDPDGIYTKQEHIAMSALAPASAIYAANIFALILGVVEQAQKSTAQHLTKLGDLVTVLDSLFVPENLKQRCLRYQGFLTIHNACKKENAGIFAAMPLNLQHDIKIHQFSSLLAAVPFLHRIPMEVQSSLTLVCEESVYGPGQMIYSKAEAADELFIIMKGYAEVCLDGIVICILHPGQHFGETALLGSSESRASSVRTRTFCMCAKIHRAMFDEVVDCEPIVKAYILQLIVSPSAPAGPPGEYTPLLSERDDHGPVVDQSQLDARMKQKKPNAEDTLARQSIIARKILAGKGGKSGQDEANVSLSKASEAVDRICTNLEALQKNFDDAESRLAAMESVYAFTAGVALPPRQRTK